MRLKPNNLSKMTREEIRADGSGPLSLISDFLDIYSK